MSKVLIERGLLKEVLFAYEGQLDSSNSLASYAGSTGPDEKEDECITTLRAILSKPAAEDCGLEVVLTLQSPDTGWGADTVPLVRKSDADARDAMRLERIAELMDLAEMLDRGNAGVAQLNGKMRERIAELEAQRDELAKLLNELLHQIDINDFMDSNGHTAKMLKAVHDGMEALSRIEDKPNEQ